MSDTEFGDWDRYGPSGAAYAQVFGLQFSDAWRFAGPWVVIGFFYLGCGLVCCSLALSIIPPSVVRGTVRRTHCCGARERSSSSE